MRKALLLLAGLLVLLAALGGGLYGLLYAMRDQGGFWAEAWRVMFGTPPNLYRHLMAFGVVAILLAFLLSPIALLETRASRAFARREEELRRELPDAHVVPYDGPEGEGVAFDTPRGRLLLLRPAQGLGAPRVVELSSDAPVAHEGSAEPGAKAQDPHAN